MSSPRPWDAATRAAMLNDGCAIDKFADSAYCIDHTDDWDTDADVCCMIDRAVEAGWRAAVEAVLADIAVMLPHHLAMRGRRAGTGFTAGQADMLEMLSERWPLKMLPTTERSQP